MILIRFSLLFVFLFSCFTTLCQTPNSLAAQDLSAVDIDKVTDEEIKSYYDKATQSGLNEQDIYRLLQERDLPRTEINKLADRLAKLSAQNSQQTANKEGAKTKTDKNPGRYDNDAANVPMQNVKSDLQVFGSELFTSSSLVFEPNLRIATPSGYILGPDDELVINVFGYSEKTYNVTVNEEGNIYIPQVGPVFVNGLSIEQAASRIKTKLATTIYKAINSGQTRVQISLGKIRSIRVTVIGEAKKPGTLTVSSLTTLFNALYLVGGPSDFGSFRKIELIRGNELKRTVDLYNFLLKGDQKDNVLLQEGDVIRIPYYKIRLTVNGHVKRKGKYELIDGESFQDVLDFTGGFADDAYKADITVYQFTDQERKILNVAKDKFGQYKPLSSDSVVVGRLLDRFANKLVLRGAVLRPGEYELSNNLTLRMLIERAGGVKEDVYSKRGSITRLASNNLPQQLSFDIDSVMRGQMNIPLRKNDEITVYSIFDLTTPEDVNIDGMVNRPGKIRYAQNLTLKDVILAAGGLTESADISNIEIARRVENTNVLAANHLQTQILVVNLTDSSGNADVLLRPHDVINIRPRPGYFSQRNVFVDGMVLHPGRYTLMMSGDRITDILKRTGGFRANADTTALVIRRPVRQSQSVEVRQRVFAKLLKIQEDSLNESESIRKEIFKDYDNISIDLSKALNNPNSSENMLLEDGDVLTIERNNNLVKVSGEVYFPTIVPYKHGENLKYYIEKSGSYTSFARKTGVLVVYPDGKARKVKRFLLFKRYPDVVSRSEIFIPQKTEKNKQKVTIGEWSVMLSSLAILANVIFNLGEKK
jgi:protein involved in polysaccharide export with SLBB domain